MTAWKDSLEDPHDAAVGRPDRPARRFPVKSVAAVAVVAVVALIGASVVSGAFFKTQAGEVAVVRNGGPVSNTQIREIVPPASSVKYIGLFSTTHSYPAQQRFYTITADDAGGDRPGVDVEQNPTADGVEVGVEATIYFSLNTDEQTLRLFDDKFGTRTFRDFNGQQRPAWDGTEGWSAFLDQIVRPVISNNIREQIGRFRCSELVASCALVQNSGAVTDVNKLSGSGNVNLAKIQTALEEGLSADIQATLGGPFLTDIKVNVVKVTLPENVQTAVNEAQAQFAKITEAQAKVAQAKAEAEANEQRQKGYAACPACAAIDQLKAIPPTISTYAPGSGFAITPQQPSP